MRKLVTSALLLALAPGYTACAEQSPSTEQAATATATATATPPGTETQAPAADTPDVKKLRCDDIEFGLTSTDTIYLVSAIAASTGASMDAAAGVVQDVCRKARPRTKAYDAAVEELGGELP